MEPTPSASTSRSGTSFAAIQQQQKDQLSNNAKPKKSLLEIQREEEEFQAEVDFMTWWTMEEERLRLQEQVTVSSSAPAKQRPYGGRGGKRPSNTKRKPAADARPLKPSNGSRRPPDQTKPVPSSSS